MGNFRSRPKGDYIQNTNWQELYVLTEHWKSDLLFYRDDLKFLHKLLQRYFIWITKEENLDAVRNLGQGILNDSKTCNDLLSKIKEHLSHLANIMDEPFKNDAHEFRTEHEELEDYISQFIKGVRENRKKVFTLTEHVLDSEHLEHLLQR